MTQPQPDARHEEPTPEQLQARSTACAGSQPLDEHDSSGVDQSLLRYMLRLTPVERLLAMDAHARDTLTLLEYGRKHRQAQAARNR